LEFVARTASRPTIEFGKREPVVLPAEFRARVDMHRIGCVAKASLMRQTRPEFLGEDTHPNLAIFRPAKVTLAPVRGEYGPMKFLTAEPVFGAASQRFTHIESIGTEGVRL
jgi:hypothetical protein